MLNVKLSGNGDQVGLQRILDYTGVGLEGFHCTAENFCLILRLFVLYDQKFMRISSYVYQSFTCKHFCSTIKRVATYV